MITKKAENQRETVQEKIKGFGPWVQWLVKKELDEYKITSAYIDMLCPSPRVKTINDSPIKKLETLVRATISKEFGDEIKNPQTLTLLVDSVMYNLQKKDLQHFINSDEAEDEE